MFSRLAINYESFAEDFEKIVNFFEKIFVRGIKRIWDIQYPNFSRSPDVELRRSFESFETLFKSFKSFEPTHRSGTLLTTADRH